MPGLLVPTPQRSRSGSASSNDSVIAQRLHGAATNGNPDFSDDSLNATPINGARTNGYSSITGHEEIINGHLTFDSQDALEAVGHLEEVNEDEMSDVATRFTRDARRDAMLYTLRYRVITAALNSTPDDQVVVYRLEDGVLVDEAMSEVDFLGFQRSTPVFHQFSQQGYENAGADHGVTEAGTSDDQNPSWPEDADSRQGNDSLSPPEEESASD